MLSLKPRAWQTASSAALSAAFAATPPDATSTFCPLVTMQYLEPVHGMSNTICHRSTSRLLERSTNVRTSCIDSDPASTAA
jgi:hypothetical protein